MTNANAVRMTKHDSANFISKLYFDIKSHQLPIIYREEYNVKFGGVEKLHPFDATKWRNIFQYLKNDNFINEDTITKPEIASTEDLLEVHTERYIDSLKWSYNVARISEIPLLALVPNCFLQECYLSRMRYQVGGSVLAGKLALERGWAINIGGGFHHCSKDRGGGFCAYADITLLIHFLFKNYPDKVQRVMIVDLDAHQGNGHERDFSNDDKVYILDIYNKLIYPRDHDVKGSIKKRIELGCYVQDNEYLVIVENNVKKAIREFKPNLLVYNAGTDILEGDPLGYFSISAEGIIERDEIVFKIAKEEKVPIVLLTSGGYQKKTAKIIATSILNLNEKGLIPHNLTNE